MKGKTGHLPGTRIKERENGKERKTEGGREGNQVVTGGTI